MNEIKERAIDREEREYAKLHLRFFTAASLCSLFKIQNLIFLYGEFLFFHRTLLGDKWH